MNVKVSLISLSSTCLYHDGIVTLHGLGFQTGSQISVPQPMLGWKVFLTWMTWISKWLPIEGTILCQRTFTSVIGRELVLNLLLNKGWPEVFRTLYSVQSSVKSRLMAGPATREKYHPQKHLEHNFP